MDDIFHFTVVEEIEMAVRIGLAALLGGAIGFERRQAEKPAGGRCWHGGGDWDVYRLCDWSDTGPVCYPLLPTSADRRWRHI
jgi:hypothetical protein